MSKPKKMGSPPVPPDNPQSDAQAGRPQSSGLVSLSASKTEVFIGPLPPPHYLEQYEEVCPGAAQIILTTFQHLTTHQMEMEKQALTSDTGRSSLGVAAGFVIGMTLIVGGVFAICLG